MTDVMIEDGRLVRIRYKDHVSFRHLDVRKVPFDRRESVGWLVNKDPDSVVVVHDRSLLSEDEWDEKHAVGLVLLRALIEEVVPLD